MGARRNVKAGANAPRKWRLDMKDIISMNEVDTQRENDGTSM